MSNDQRTPQLPSDNASDPQRATPDGPAQTTSMYRLGWRVLPNLFVLGTIISVALIGHHTEWTFGLRQHSVASTSDETTPAMTLETVSSAGQTSQLCAPHGVFDCPHCDPKQAQMEPRPEISADEINRVRSALVIRSRPEVPSVVTTWRRTVQFASAEAVETAGIDVAPVWREAVTETLPVSGELQFDAARLARLPARVAGSAWRVYKQTGSEVWKGEILALIESAAISSAKAELQQALVRVRLKRQAYANIQHAPVADRQKRETKAELQEAESHLLSAEQSLVNFGFKIRAMDLLDQSTDSVSRMLQMLELPPGEASETEDSIPGSLLPIRASFDGVVLDSNVIAGEVVSPDQILFSVVDPTRLWLVLAVPTRDIGLVKVGQDVRFRPDGSSRTVTGPVTWIGTTADERTRTIPIRVDIANDAGALRAYSLGQGEIVLREDAEAIVVPIEAVQRIGDTSFVFVRSRDYFESAGSKTFHLRAVRLGASAGLNVEVLAGVYPGEVVVTKGSALLINEISKNQAARFASTRRTRRAATVTARSPSNYSETERK